MYGRGIDLKILLVNSDQDFIDNFKYSFKTEDYTITSTKTIKEAIDAFSKYHYDLAIIDMKYKDGTGLDLKRQMNEVRNIPTIVVSETKEANEVVLALEYGCDDYIVRPFYLLELKARIRSVLRRSIPNKPTNENSNNKQLNTVKTGDFEFNMLGRKVRINTTDIELTGKEFDLLFILATNKDKIFTRHELAQELWEGVGESNIRTVDVHIRRLREKLTPSDTYKYIKTAWGEGYYFNDDE